MRGPSKFDFRNHGSGSPKETDTPSTRREGGGGPSKFDFRNHFAWTPPMERHPSTRRGPIKETDTPPRGGRREEGTLKIRFSKSFRLNPQRNRDPSTEGALKIPFSKSLALGPPKEQTPLHEEARGGPSKCDFRNHDTPVPKEVDTPSGGASPERRRESQESAGKPQEGPDAKASPSRLQSER